MPHDIKGLERDLKAIGDLISKTHDAKHADRLLAIVHRPGWTTVREEELVRTHITALHNHANALHSGFEELVKIADKIGTS
jgi:hypothetical protein